MHGRYVVQREEMYEGWCDEADFATMQEAEFCYVRLAFRIGHNSVRIIQVVLYVGED